MGPYGKLLDGENKTDNYVSTIGSYDKTAVTYCKNKEYSTFGRPKQKKRRI